MIAILLFLPILLFMEGDISPLYADNVHTITIGETISWTNTHEFAHTISSGTPHGVDGVFDSGLLMQGDTWERTFDDFGTFPYFCMAHPWETGRVVVVLSSNTTIEAQIVFDSDREPTPLELENQRLRQRVTDLEAEVADLTAIILEQLHVIYEWVISR